MQLTPLELLSPDWELTGGLTLHELSPEETPVKSGHHSMVAHDMQAPFLKAVEYRPDHSLLCVIVLCDWNPTCSDAIRDKNNTGSTI